jgi:hypothetical protein
MILFPKVNCEKSPFAMRLGDEEFVPCASVNVDRRVVISPESELICSCSPTSILGPASNIPAYELI